jgi:uncharacterized protein YbjT (DUF2867 family)
LVHSADKAASLKGANAEAVVGDFTKPDSVRGAFSGVDKLFLVSPADKPATVSSLEAPVVEAARKAGVTHVVKLSVIGCNLDNPINLGRWHREAERRVEASGIPWTFLRPNFFTASFAVYMGATIRAQRTFYAPAHDGKISMIDPRDVAVRSDGVC